MTKVDNDPLLGLFDEVSSINKEENFGDFFSRHFGYTLLSEQLKLHDIFKNWLENGGLELVLAMRSIGKTDIISIASVCYDLIYGDGQRTFLIASKSAPTLADIASKCAEILTADIKPQLSVCSAQRVVLKNNLKKQPNIRFVLLRSGARGARADHVIFDDAVAESDGRAAERKQTQSHYNKVFNIQPNMLIIGQYAHEDDLHSALERHENSGKVKVHRFWWKDVSDELKAAIGRPNLEDLTLGNTERELGHNYLGKHINDEAEFYFKDVRLGEFALSPTSFAVIDPAFTHNGQSDRTGLAVGFREGEQYYAQVFEYASAIQDIWQELLESLAELGVLKVYIETNNGGNIILNMMKRHVAQHRIPLRVDGIVTSTGKANKIARNLNPIKHLLILHKECHHACVRRWHKNSSEHDDGIDALAMLVEKLAVKR